MVQLVINGIRFQIGMLNQQQEFVGKWYLQFAIFINPDFKKTEEN